MGKLSSSQKHEICQRYQAGEAGTALAKDYQISWPTIYRTLRRRGVRVRPSREANRRLALDQTVFDTITEQSAYWAGFLMADGSIVLSKRHSAQIKMSTSAKDKDHICAFRDFLGSEHKIVSTQVSAGGKKYPRFQLTVNSDKLAMALSKFGIVPRKSHTAKAKLLENNAHFWRGIIDGDGSISIRRRQEAQLSLVGSKPLMHQFLDFTLSICDHGVHVRPHKSIFSVSFLGRYAKAVITHLYADCAIALPRKLAIAQQIMSS